MDMFFQPQPSCCTFVQYPIISPVLQALGPCLRGRAARGSHSAGRESEGPALSAANMPVNPSRLARAQVTKKLAPHQPGAKKLSQRYGDALVCVRYRQDLEGARRYTTVEIVVDEGPIAVDRPKPPEVHLRIPFNDLALRQAVIEQGGIWDSQLRLWRLSPAAARALQRQARNRQNLPTPANRNGKD
jgi:hypothetical protein